MLACPMCRASLNIIDMQEERLDCKGCERWYPIANGIPMMLPDHEQNMKGESLNEMFQNPPGISARKTERMGWYYNTPDLVSGMEEGSWRTFSYRNVNGTVLEIGAGDRNIRNDLGKVSDFVTMDLIPRDNPTVVADAHALPFKDGIFDAVIARAVMEHVENEHKVLSEVYRVLKPNGLFIFSAPFIYPIHDAVDHHRFTIYTLRSLAHEHDFEIMRISSQGGYFGLLAHHLFLGLKMIRESIDEKYKKKSLVRNILRGFADGLGMLIYLPFYALIPLDKKYREVAREKQGRIPFVKGYGAVFRKME